MIGLGTIINSAGIVLGGIAGLLFGRFLKARFQDSLNMACGISVLFIGIAGAMEGMYRAYIYPQQLGAEAHGRDLCRVPAVPLDGHHASHGIHPVSGQF